MAAPRSKPPHWPKRSLQWAFRKIGYVVYPIDTEEPIGHEDRRRARLLANRGTTVVLDVGANIGQFARRIRRLGYVGRIVSFEPIEDAYERLQAKAESDGAWSCRRLALGEDDGSVAINVSENSYSSSLLEIGESHLAAAPESRYVDRQDVPIARLDTIWPEIVRPADNVYLKLDVQGFELSVLRGAERSLPSIDAVQTELSLVPLYEGAPTYMEVINHLEARGFILVGFEAGHEIPGTGEVVQVDGVFVRPRTAGDRQDPS